MKKTMIFLCIFLGIVSCNPKHDIETDKDEIVKALMRSAENWNKGDMEAYMQVYWRSEKLQFIGASGITYGWQKTLDNYIKRYPTADHTGELTFEILNLEYLAEDLYTLTGKYYLVRPIGDANGIFTLIFKKIDNKWVIISDHTQ